jgi:DNA-binding HxlR family transcriptional regulator
LRATVTIGLVPQPDDGACGCVAPNEHGADCYCAVTPLIHALGKRHSLSILSYLGAHERARFNAIQDRLDGLSSSTLAARLDELEQSGLVARTTYDEAQRVEYRLTARGRAIQQMLKSLFPRSR